MRKKILIVDDEESVLTLLDARLTANGYEVFKAPNGKTAIELAKEKRPNLIILDIMMPEMDGAQVAEILKGDPDTKGIPIIFLTCLLTKEEEKIKGHSIGANIFLAKPYEPQELLSEIKNVIS